MNVLICVELSRVSQVTREGKYVQSNVPRQLVYGTMVYVRQTIVSDASTALSRAVCIATRYSAVRRQFGSRNGSIETQVSFEALSMPGCRNVPIVWRYIGYWKFPLLF